MQERIEISRQDLVWAASQGLVAQDAVDDMWNQLQVRRHREPHNPTLSSSHVAYYLGSGVVILGMCWILGMAWDEEWGGFVVFGIASAYMAVFGWTGHYVWFEKRRHIPGGLLVSLAMCMVPIAVYGFQYGVGLWYRPSNTRYYDPFWTDHDVKELCNFLPMELGGVLAAALTFYWMPFPFLLALIASVFWYMVCDWAVLVRRKQNLPYWVSMVYGILCLLAAFVLERRLNRRHSNGNNTTDSSGEHLDYAFWIYLVGAVAFWSGLESPYLQSEGAYFAQLLANVCLIILSVVVKRRIFTILGTLGVVVYLFHLNDLFGELVFFPFLITALGVAIITIGGYRSSMADNEITSRLLESQQDVAQNGGGPSNTVSIALEEHVSPQPDSTTAQEDESPVEEHDIPEIA